MPQAPSTTTPASVVQEKAAHNNWLAIKTAKYLKNKRLRTVSRPTQDLQVHITMALKSQNT